MNIEVGKGVTLQRKPTNENSAIVVGRTIKKVNFENKTFVCDDAIRYKFSDVIYEAKSGRIYHNIPNELDVDTWDKMLVAERLRYKGLITDPNATQYNPYEEKC
jgi:hypothetical protein